MRERIIETIETMVKQASLPCRISHQAWKTPLVGFADAGDPLFGELKTAVRPSHGLPGDLPTRCPSR